MTEEEVIIQLTGMKDEAECYGYKSDSEVLGYAIKSIAELKQLKERVKSLEHSAEYYHDSLFGDGIVFSLKIMRGNENDK